MMQQSKHQSLCAVFMGACAFAAMTLAGHAAGAIATPDQKCAAAKIRAAAKKANVQLGCYARATLQGVPVDQRCLTRAGSALVSTFQRAELKWGCVTVGDHTAIENTVDAFVDDIASALPAVPSPTPTLTITPTPTATATPSATITQTEAPTSIQSPFTGTVLATPTATTTPTVTRTPTLTPTSIPGPNDCCQSGLLCGPPSGGACPGAVPVFNASCLGSSGQCVTFTPAPTNTATPTGTPPTQTPTATATNTSGPMARVETTVLPGMLGVQTLAMTARSVERDANRLRAAASRLIPGQEGYRGIRAKV